MNEVHLKDRWVFRGISEKPPSATSLDAELGLSEETEYWAEFAASGSGPIRFTLSASRRKTLELWQKTDPIRLYEVVGGFEVGFYNERLGERFVASELTSSKRQL